MSYKSFKIRKIGNEGEAILKENIYSFEKYLLW